MGWIVGVIGWLVVVDLPVDLNVANVVSWVVIVVGSLLVAVTGFDVIVDVIAVCVGCEVVTVFFGWAVVEIVVWVVDVARCDVIVDKDSVVGWISV